MTEQAMVDTALVAKPLADEHGYLLCERCGMPDGAGLTSRRGGPRLCRKCYCDEHLPADPQPVKVRYEETESLRDRLRRLVAMWRSRGSETMSGSRGLITWQCADELEEELDA